MRERIAIIGSGNMGQAIARGLLDNKIITQQQLFLTNSQTGNKEAITKADIIILAVKPQNKDTVFEEIKEVVTNQLIISVMAGITIESIQNSLGGKNSIIRVMPNIAAKIGKSMSVWIKNPQVSSTQTEKIKLILEAIGQQLELHTEDQIDKATAISGSGPAYIFYLTEILENAAIKIGFSDREAKLLAEQTLIGSAELLQKSKESATNLRSAVTSKGGTTEAAITILQKENIQNIFSKAITAAYTRAKKLGENLRK